MIDDADPCFFRHPGGDPSESHAKHRKAVSCQFMSWCIKLYASLSLSLYIYTHIYTYLYTVYIYIYIMFTYIHYTHKHIYIYIFNTSKIPYYLL